jgi:hypothetical protein
MKTRNQQETAAPRDQNAGSVARSWAPPKIRRLATSAAEISATPDVDGVESTS